MKKLHALVISGLFIMNSELYSQGSEQESLFIHNFGQDPDQDFSFANREAGLNLKETSPGFRLQQKSDSILRESGLHPRVQMRSSNRSSLQLQSDSRMQSISYRFEVDGIPFCEYQVKAHESINGAKGMFGRMPRVEVDREYVLSDWPSPDALQSVISDALLDHGVTAGFRRNAEEACLWNQDGALIPVWKLEVDAGNLHYTVIADDTQVYKFQAKHFHATGSARIYPHNVLDNAMETFSLRDMKETGYLENRYFITVVEQPFEFAINQQLNFTYDPTISAEKPKFVETSVFTNANRALEWLETVGYKNFGTVPLRLAVHAVFSGDTNNALYQPGSNYDTIFVGDGDGIWLQNLGTDADVVGHELGHHVVYHTVTEISGESLVIHEGLADYFNFARTGNACLGESICPDTSQGNRICYVPKTCLRTGENTLKYPSLPSEPHQKSQFISGMLWDLSAKDNIERSKVTTLVLNAIDLLVEDSGYQHLVIGLLLADNAVNGGANCSTILNRAVARGLETFLAGVSCATIAAEGPGIIGSTKPVTNPPASTAPATTTSKSSKKQCGTLGGGSASGQGLSFLLIFILPLLPVLTRRRKL